LNSIALTAAKYGRAIEPLLCLSIDFYVRLFLLVKQSPAQVKHLASNTMITYNCTGCGSWSNQHLGRTSEKGEQTKFQLNSGPSTDSLCKHCGYRQMVLPIHIILMNSWQVQCGQVPSIIVPSWKNYNKQFNHWMNQSIKPVQGCWACYPLPQKNSTSHSIEHLRISREHLNLRHPLLTSYGPH